MTIRTLEKTRSAAVRALMLEGQKAQAKYRREEIARKNGARKGTRGVSFVFPHGEGRKNSGD